MDALHSGEFGTEWSRAIRSRMRAWGWSQRQVAELLDVPVTTVNTWVKGHSRPSDDAKALLVERLMLNPRAVAPDWLKPALDDAEHAPPPPPLPTGGRR